MRMPFIALVGLVALGDRLAGEEPVRRPAAPLGPAALVPAPPRLPGVTGWTVETFGDDSPSFAVPVFSPDGKWAAARGRGGVVRVWDVALRRLARVLYPAAHGYRPGVVQVAWAPDSKRLAGFLRYGRPDNGSNTGVAIWDVDSAREEHFFRQSIPESSSGLAWSPTRPVLAVVVGTHGRVEFLDTRTGAGLGTVPAADERPGRDGPQRPWITHLAWSPDGNQLALVAGQSDRRAVEVWDYARKAKVYTPLDGVNVSDPVVRPSWSPDGKRIAFRTGEQDVKVVDVGGQRVVTAVKVETKSPGEVRYDWTDAGELAGVAAGDGYYDAKTGKRLEQGWDVKYYWLAWSPDRKSLAFAGVDWGLLDLATGKHDRWEPPLAGFLSDWSDDGKRIVTATRREDEGFSVWDVAGLKLERTFVPKEAEQGGVRQLRAAAKGKILHMTDTGTVRGWDVKDGRVAWEKPKFADSRGRLAGSVSQDLVFVLTMTDNDHGQVSVLNPQTGKEYRSFAVNDTYELSVSPDGLRLAAGRGKVQFWDVLTTKSVELPEALAKQGSLPAWSPDGKLVSQGERVFELPTWKEAARLEKYWADSSPALWSADGKVLTDRRGRVWEARTGRLLSEEYLGDAVFSPDSSRLLGAGRGGFSVWNVGARRWEAHLFRLGNDKGFCISGNGHYSGLTAAEAERHLAYVVQTAKGQEVLTPAEFARRFGWVNDPAKVRLDAQ